MSAILTVSDLIAELSTVDRDLKVFVFDGAEAFPIEVSRVIHWSHDPHVWIQSAHYPADGLARLTREQQRLDEEIAELSDSIDQKRRRLRDSIKYRNTLRELIGRAEERTK